MAKAITPTKDCWIYWCYKGENSFKRSYIQKIMETDSELFLLLFDPDNTRQPIRVLRKEIFIVKQEEPDEWKEIPAAG